MMAALQSTRQLLSPLAHVSVARVLAAKSDLLSVQRTSSGRERAAAQCQINKVLIGKVYYRRILPNRAADCTYCLKIIQ